jgi:hypothetical protein
LIFLDGVFIRRCQLSALKVFFQLRVKVGVVQNFVSEVGWIMLLVPGPATRSENFALKIGLKLCGRKWSSQKKAGLWRVVSVVSWSPVFCCTVVDGFS